MIYFAGIEEDSVLESCMGNILKDIPEADQIAIGKPLRIELLSVQLANLDLEERDGRRERSKALEPVVLSQSKATTKSNDGTNWDRPEVHQLHYNAILNTPKKFVNYFDMKTMKRSSWIHYIPVYDGQTITFNLSIHELDRPLSEETKKAIDNIFDVAGAAFLPYTPYIFGAKKLFEVFVKLGDASLKNDQFISENMGVQWAPGDPLLHHATAGRMVCIQDSLPSRTPLPAFEAKKYRLSAQNRLVNENNQPLEDRCYAVLYVSVRPLSPGDEFANSQKAATLLSEIERQQDKEDGHIVVWQQLLNTMKAYSTGTQIKIILELKDKQTQGTITEDELAKLKGFLELQEIKDLSFYEALKI